MAAMRLYLDEDVHTFIAETLNCAAMKPPRLAINVVLALKIQTNSHSLNNMATHW